MTQPREGAAPAPTRIVAERIKWLRSRRGWSGADLATELQDLGINWSQSIVANLESGRRPYVTVDELFALARALGVSPMALVGMDDPEAAIATSRAMLYSAALLLAAAGVGNAFLDELQQSGELAEDETKMIKMLRDAA